MSTSTRSSSTSDIYVLTSSFPPSSASASARSSLIRVGGSGAIETPFMWVLASKPAVMPVLVSMLFAFGRGKVSGSSSLKKGKDKDKDKDKESKKEKERDSKDKGKRKRTTSVGVSDDLYTVHMEHSNMNPNSNLHMEVEFDTTATGGVFAWLNNHADPNISDESVSSALYEPVYEPSEGGGMGRTMMMMVRIFGSRSGRRG